MENDLSKIIQQVREISGKNDKISFLQSKKNHPHLKDVFYLALHPFTHWFKHHLPETNRAIPYNEGSIVAELSIFNSNKGSSRSDINAALETIAASCNGDNAPEGAKEFWESIIQKDINCGVAETTVNKVWGKDFIKKFQPMKGEEAAYLDKLEGDLIAQLKLDGCRMPVVVKGGVCTLFSSSGREFPGLQKLKDDIVQFGIDNNLGDFSLDSELIFNDEDNLYPLPREISNGLANKALNGNLSKEQEERAVAWVFDRMAPDALLDGDPRPYTERFLEAGLVTDIPSIKLVSSFVMASRDAIQEFLDAAVERGEEGIMVKTMNHPYETKRSKHWVKLKKEYDVDLRVIAVKDHKKKEGMIGSLEVESEDGVIVGSVGSKLSNAQRKELYQQHYEENKVVGSVYTIRIHCLTKKKGQISIYLPRVIERRFDKDEADSSQKIFDMVKWEG